MVQWRTKVSDILIFIQRTGEISLNLRGKFSTTTFRKIPNCLWHNIAFFLRHLYGGSFVRHRQSILDNNIPTDWIGLHAWRPSNRPSSDVMLGGQRSIEASFRYYRCQSQGMWPSLAPALDF